MVALHHPVRALLVAAVILAAGCGKVELTNPVVSGFTPAKGVAGSQVTITGSRFSATAAGNVVRFNGVTASVVSATTSQLVVTVPSGATTGPISVTTSGGFGGSFQSFTVLRLVGGSVQGSPLSPAGKVSTLAGSPGVAGAADGTGAAARFFGPFGLATDGTTLYVTDRGNHTIRALTIATGEVTTIAGGAGSAGSADGTGTAARFDSPAGITYLNGALYICDSGNSTIRRLSLSGAAVTTIAGSPGATGSADGTGSAARFSTPTGITTDGSFLYVCDTGNHTVRRIDPATGAVITIAGLAGIPGGTDSPPRFDSPAGITSDGVRLFIADRDNQTLRLIALNTGAVTTLAGFAGVIGSADGVGQAARFNVPTGIGTDGGTLFVGDTGNDTIRTFVPTTSTFTAGTVATLAGVAGFAGTADGTGSGALFDGPAGVTTDGDALYIADSLNDTIRVIR